VEYHFVLVVVTVAMTISGGFGVNLDFTFVVGFSVTSGYRVVL
jgi:hypothetical protein